MAPGQHTSGMTLQALKPEGTPRKQGRLGNWVWFNMWRLPIEAFIQYQRTVLQSYIFTRHCCLIVWKKREPRNLAPAFFCGLNLCGDWKKAKSRASGSTKFGNLLSKIWKKYSVLPMCVHCHTLLEPLFGVCLLHLFDWCVGCISCSQLPWHCNSVAKQQLWHCVVSLNENWESCRCPMVLPVMKEQRKELLSEQIILPVPARLSDTLIKKSLSPRSSLCVI